MQDKPSRERIIAVLARQAKVSNEARVMLAVVTDPERAAKRAAAVERYRVRVEEQRTAYAIWRQCEGMNGR